MSLMRLSAITLLMALCVPITAFTDQPAYPEMMVVLDGSGSMWGKAGEETKIEAARGILQQVILALPGEVRLGLAAYGHNRKGDCEDIEILVPPGSDDREGLLEKALAIMPKGKTPIAATLGQVTDLLQSRESETAIVLISDGEETCHDDPCGAVAKMRDAGIRFVLHVVGFGVDELQQEQLSCLAEAGGGDYYAAEDADGLLTSLEQVSEAIEQKVEQAKTTTRKATSALGKLQITIPADGLVSLNELQLVRSSDGKLVKSIKDPDADSLHPLLAGEYELVAGFANTNYADDSTVSFGAFTVTGGETTLVELGLLMVNISAEMASTPAGAVIIMSTSNADFVLSLPYNGNDYYLYKPKPLPAGSYALSVHYKRSYLYRTEETPVLLAQGIQVPAAGHGVATVDSGIKLLKPQAGGMTGFELVSSDPAWGTMKIESASNGDHPLWQPYAVPPGQYQLNVYLEGMGEALPVAGDIEIEPGVLLEFDTGL